MDRAIGNRLDRGGGNYGVSYKKAQIYTTIKSLGLTYQKAKGVYPEADPIAKQGFKEQLKKPSWKSHRYSFIV